MLKIKKTIGYEVCSSLQTHMVLFLESVNPNHPCHHVSKHPQTHRHIRTTPQKHKDNILQKLPSPINDNNKKHIHIHITINALSRVGTNSMYKGY